MLKIPSALDSSIQSLVDKDSEFQNSLVSLSDEEKSEAIDVKKSELLEQELASLAEKAEKVARAEELAQNFKTRSEKAEGELKKIKPESKPEGELLQKDLRALLKSNVHEDDEDDVISYARLKNISVADALKSGVIKTLLAEKAEERKTAEAANTGTSRHVTSKVTDEALMEEASKGNIPERGSEEAERLFWARHKKNK